MRNDANFVNIVGFKTSKFFVADLKNNKMNSSIWKLNRASVDVSMYSLRHYCSSTLKRRGLVQLAGNVSACRRLVVAETAINKCALSTVASVGTFRQLSASRTFLARSQESLSLHTQLAKHLSTVQYDNGGLKPYVAAPHSYAFGRSTNNLEYKTIGQLLEERVVNENGRPAIISHHENIKKTFTEFNDDVNRLVKAMYEDLGLKRGDVVGLWSCNKYDWLVIQYASARLGVVLCTINPFYQVLELDYVLRRADIKTLFMPGQNSKQEIVNKFSKILTETLNVDDKTCHEPLQLQHIVSIDGEPYTDSHIPSKRPIKVHSYQKLTDRSPDVDRSIIDQVVPDDPAIIMFTSGTTGKPKGAFLSHFTTVNNAKLTAKSLFKDSDQLTVCVPLPFFHSFAGVLGNISVSASNFQIVIPCLKYDVAQMVESINAHKVTHMLATPTLTIDMLNYVRKNNIQTPSLKGLLAGGASMPVEVAHKFVETIPSCLDFRIGYGATELGPCSTACRPSDTFEQRTETVGTPLDFVEIKVINPETKTVVKLGECGEIHSRGHNTMLGYWKDPEKTKEGIDSSGWYNTGDLGVMDENGFLKIIGRTKELIIVGGENVYPREIEELLHTHPAVANVHVIGVPDPRKGEEVCAWVQLAGPNAKVTEEELKKFCQDNISYFKVPKYFMFVNEFPITSTGKAQKFKMREITCKKLNLKEN